MDDGVRWPWWVVGVFLAVEALLAAYFTWSRDWARKERWFLPVAVGSTMAYLAWVLFGGYRRFVVTGLLTVAISVTAVRQTRFCHRCGRTNVLRGNPRRRHCRECGLDLTTQSAGAG